MGLCKPLIISISIFETVEDGLEEWKSLLVGTGFRCIHETKAFAQFESGAENLRLDLMLVDAPTFAKLQAGE